ncbi:MAG: argininosuccinate lyase [Phycisphaerae bacterium]
MAKADALKQKSWQARIGGNTDSLAEQFVESISFDQRMAKHDIVGSVAHATMLQHVGLINRKELKSIKAGLASILKDIQAGSFVFDVAQEDIHMAVEKALIERIGEPGKKLHTGRSRNDQVALDVRLWTIEALDLLDGALGELQKAYVTLAETDGHVVMPSFTHLQRAQPIMAGHELLAYVEMLHRDRARLADCGDRTKVLPLGAGAVGGTTLPIDRAYTAKLLGFPTITDNSLDSISDRDFLCEFAFDLSMVAMHLSRWAEQWILYTTTEFGFIRIDDAYTTGSSMMPQKRNPDMLELIRGKTGGVYGQLVALLTMMKGQPLAYNRDMQEDKRCIFFAFDQVLQSVRMAQRIIAGTRLVPVRINAKLDEGFADATVLAEYLVNKGIPFRTAHHVVGSLVARCEELGLTQLSQLELPVLQSFNPTITQDVYEFLGANNVVTRYRSHGAGGPVQLRTQLRKWQKLLAKA